MIRIALLGVGHIHTPSFARTLAARSDLKVVGVYDVSAVRRNHFAEQLSAPALESYQTVLSDCDAVVISGRTVEHAAVVAEVTKAGKHLFVEKPLGMNFADATKMADAIEAKNLIFQTGYFMRSDPKIRFIREQVQKGNLGSILRVRGSNCHSGSLGGWFDAKPGKEHDDWRWMADPTQGGVAALGDLGTHMIDVLMWINGPMTEVSATISPGTNRYDGVDELGEGTLTFANGSLGSLSAGWVDYADPMTLSVSGTDGHAAIVNGQVYLRIPKSKTDGNASVAQDDLPQRLPHAFDLFLDKLVGKDVPLVSVREAASRNAVTDALYASARNNGCRTKVAS